MASRDAGYLLPENALADGEFLQVVGGVGKGGIVVRAGAELTSELIQKRLATGSLVKKLALTGERLQYQLVLGEGPAKGWVTARREDGTPLVLPQTVLSSQPGPGGTLPEDWSTAPPPEASERDWPPVTGRNLRILALHGSSSNSNILNFQLGRLCKVLGKGVDWFMPDGPVKWTEHLMPPGSLPNAWYEPRPEIEVTLSKGKPFASWIDLAEFEDGLGGDAIPASHDASMAFFRDYVAKEGPFDVALAFSQGANILDRYEKELHLQGARPPWRLNVFFSPAPFGRYYDPHPSSQPTLLVGTYKDEEFGGRHVAKRRLRCSAITVLEHEDGHAFPATQPRAAEVYEEVAAAIKKYCFAG